jgi:hypothetical protein
VVAPTVRLLIAIGPFATAALSHTWRRQRTDLPSGGIDCIPLQLTSPPTRPHATPAMTIATATTWVGRDRPVTPSRLTIEQRVALPSQ